MSGAGSGRPQPRRERRTLALGAIALLGLSLYVALRWSVTTDIAHFLPRGEVGDELSLARQIVSSELSRTMILLVGGAADTAEVAAASRELEAALRAAPAVATELASLDGGPPAGMEEVLWTLYFPRRLGFLAQDAAGARAATSPDALREAAAKLKRRLELPISGLLSRVAPADPLLIVPGLFERLAAARGDGLQLADGRFVTEDGRSAVLFIATEAASFDSARQRPFLAGIVAAFEGVNAAHGGRLHLAQSGGNRFAVSSEDAIRADIERVSTWSVLALVALFLWLFRSLRLGIVTLIVVGAGFVVATAACLALFGSVHALTLAFGSGLIGVSVDYTIHFYCHHSLAPDPGGPRRTLAGIWTGLALGAATTVVGFVALVASSFPALRELAVFGAFGIAAALVCTRVFLPGLVPAVARPTRSSRRVAAALGSAVEALDRRRWLAWLVPAVVLAVGLAGLPRVRWNDDFADFNRLDPALVQEDAGIRAQVVRYEQRRMVVCAADDEESALQANERVADALAGATAAGELAGCRSVASMLPSAARQREVDAAVRSDAALWPRLRDALAAEGFRAEAFQPFHEALSAPAPAPLLPADLATSPVGPLVRPFRITLDRGFGVLTFLNDLRDAPAVQRRLAGIPGAHLVDMRAAFAAAYGGYRSRMQSLLLYGVLAVVGLVALRHRALRPTLSACAPGLLAALGTVGLFGLLGVPLNVLSLVALLMIVSMGDDFGVFLAETGERPGELAATHLAVFFAGLTTILGFGLLSFSDNPALFSVGATTGIGVSLCLILAPTLHMLISVRRKATS